MKNFLRHSLLLAVMLWGAMASAQGGGGNSVERTYDRQNRVVSCTDSAGNQIGYRYYASGKLAKRIYPGGTENGLGHVEYTYWATGQLKEVIDRLSSVESPRVTTFYWDEGGSLTRVVRPNGTERQISYDFAGRPEIVREVAADGRLIKLFKNQYFPSDQLQSLYQLPYGKGQQETPLAKSVYGAVGSMEYNADNQLVRFEGENVVHDLDGNMVYGPLPGGVMSGYSYDSRNRLLSSGGLSYSYDPEGERIGAGGNGDAIHYVNEVNHGLSQVLRRTKNGAETTYVWGIGLLYEVGADGEAVYYHYDNVGSTIALSNEAGVAIERMEYEPYGTLVHRAREAGYEGALHDTAYLFAGFYGYQTDSSGLVYLRERYYNPLTRRFINPDPAREGWNWYAYAGGDPMGFVDPSGLGTESVLDAVQTGLSALGMMPIVGAAFDILNAGISFVSGQHVAALMNLASAVPGLGDAFAAGKMALAGAKVAAASLGAGMAAFGKVGGGVKINVAALDFSTGANKAVFYSGRGNHAKAMEFAKRTGTTPIDLTPGGQYLNSLKLYEIMPAKQADAIWAQASRAYASGAHGKINLFVKGAHPNRVYHTIEAPIIKENKNVYKQTLHY